MILGFEHSVALSVTVKAVGAGYMLGMFYLFFIFLNSLWNKHTVSVFLRDILYFCVSAVFCFLFILKYNAGVFRFYIFAGLITGFLIFYIFPGTALGEYFRKHGERLKNKGRKVKNSIYCSVHKQVKQINVKKRELRKKSASKNIKRKAIKKDNTVTAQKKEGKNKNNKKIHKKISLLNKNYKKNL